MIPGGPLITLGKTVSVHAFGHDPHGIAGKNFLYLAGSESFLFQRPFQQGELGTVPDLLTA